jgi:hypothetical protein
VSEMFLDGRLRLEPCFFELLPNFLDTKCSCG